MNAETKSSSVEMALSVATTMQTVLELRKATGLDEPTVRAELRTLAQQGQIEHIPGRGRYDGRYGLLRPIAKPAPAVASDDVTLTNEGKTSADREGGETDVRAVPEPQYDPRSVSFNPAERVAADAPHPNSNAALAARISKIGSGIAPNASGMNIGTFQVADLIALVRDEQARNEMSLLNVIADIRSAVGDKTGKIMLGELAAHIGEIYQLGEAHRSACVLWENSMMNAIGEDGVGSVVEAIGKRQAELANAIALNMKLEHLLGVERQANAALREQLDATHEAHDEVAGRTVGYAVVAPKRPIRRFTKPDKARDAAMAAAANGSGRGEVFALVQIGTAKRGANWIPVK